MLEPSVLRRLVTDHLSPATAPAPLPGLHRLTAREIEVLTLLAQAHSNEEIATSLHLSQSTVKTHIARTLTKLDARDRIHLAVLAHKHGLV